MKNDDSLGVVEDIHDHPSGAIATKAAPRAIIVDLNRFTSFPTLAIGLLTAALRARGCSVRVICLLALGMPAAVREREEGWKDDLRRRIRLTEVPVVRRFRDASRPIREWFGHRTGSKVQGEIHKAISDGADVILLSAYLENLASVKAIAAIGKANNIPVVLGGPMFNLSPVSEAWRTIPGITAVVGAEAERDLPDLLEAVCAGKDLLRFRGVTLPSGEKSPAAPPLRKLDQSHFPDYTDFPWDRYPNRIIPMMSGRGCQWDKCTFCSDVISASGRTFRTRSVENVLVEMETQAERHNAKDFMFLDLKLNSFPAMLRGISKSIQTYVPGAQWIGTVHVDQRPDNGLTRRELFDASAAGMRRVSFGLESGSQRLLDAMYKGCTVTQNARFLRNAYDAGLSVRCTMFKGYPGEVAQDMQATADFLEQNARYIDRIRFNDFALLLGTPIHAAVTSKADAVRDLEGVVEQGWRAQSSYNTRQTDRAYRTALSRVLATVYEINRKPMRAGAVQFDGLM